jgi:phosphatidate cytidylyltransferase
MSLQGATEGSDSPKTRSLGPSFLRRLFTYEGTGSLKDRLLTACYVIVGAFGLTLATLYLPYGGFVCVAVVTALVAMAAFEVVRLFARHNETLAYRPMAGVAMYTVLTLPAAVAAVSAVFGVLSGEVWWRQVYVATIIAAEAFMLGLVLEGRMSLEAGGRFAQRYGVGFFILSLCAPALIVISGLPRGIAVLWWIVGCAALNDTAAYFVGRAIGAHKMAPALSPNKSLEGCVAGLLVGTISGVVLWQLIVETNLPLSSIGLLSLAVTVAAQTGDLAKSYLKRLRGVKDLGALLPGHGGVLDRFDALIAAAPVVLAALVFFGLV